MPTRRRFLSVLAASCAASMLPLSRAHAESTRLVSTWRGTAMGAVASLTLVHPDRAAARRLIDSCVTEIARLEAIFSLYRDDSALCRLNAAGEAANPPHELIELLSFALALSRASDGAFDPTVQPLYRLHADAYARHPERGPSADAINSVLRLVDYRAVEIGSDRIRLRRRGMAITLNGIAQGYITDRIAERLHSAGMENVLIDLGEARALGHRADGGAWHAAVRDPRDPQRTRLDLAMGDGAVSALATSAGYATPLGADPRAHHLLDPRTGRSANHHLSVSVTAPQAALADGLSTALFVSSPHTWQSLLRHHPLARAYVVSATGELSTPST
jgi:thiamine biosynthesis lipoprotein